MKINYDKEVDVLRILFNDAPIHESDESTPGVILDFDAQENLVGLEILGASHRVQDPHAVEFSEAAGASP